MPRPSGRNAGDGRSGYPKSTQNNAILGFRVQGSGVYREKSQINLSPSPCHAGRFIEPKSNLYPSPDMFGILRCPSELYSYKRTLLVTSYPLCSMGSGFSASGRPYLSVNRAYRPIRFIRFTDCWCRVSGLGLSDVSLYRGP